SRGTMMNNPPISLSCEHVTNPLGLDVRWPRLNWKMDATHRGVRQTAYHILVAQTPARLEAAVAGQAKDGVLWDTGKVISADSVLVPYAGAALQPGQRCHWCVRVWDENDAVSPWSETAWWE